MTVSALLVQNMFGVFVDTDHAGMCRLTDLTAGAIDGSSCAKHAARITQDLNFFFMSSSSNAVYESAIC